jgi:protein-tyrosine phosphatase
MFVDDDLDHHLVHEVPQPLFMGELPSSWDLIPAPVVVNLCGVYPHGDPGGRQVLGLPLLDVLDRALSPPRADLERFLATVHDAVGDRASYWHCHAGLNRSGLAVAAYLHLYRGVRIGEAIVGLRERRSGLVLCNHVFEGLLREWYGEEDEQEFQRVGVATWLRERNGRRESP